MSVLCMCTLCVPGAQEGQKRTSITPGTGVTDGCEPPYGYWESNVGPLQEQMFSTVGAISWKGGSFISLSSSLLLGLLMYVPV